MQTGDPDTLVPVVGRVFFHPGEFSLLPGDFFFSSKGMLLKINPVAVIIIIREFPVGIHVHMRDGHIQPYDFQGRNIPFCFKKSVISFLF